MGGFRRRFTLVELMIVVAIIMVLAAIAIPNFNDMQLRAKVAESPTNVDGIKNAMIAYEAAENVYPTGGYNPSSNPGKTPVSWTLGSNFDTLGWSPDGAIRGRYQFSGIGQIAVGTCLIRSCVISSDTFCAFGRTDVDGNGLFAIYKSNATTGPVRDAACDTY